MPAVTNTGYPYPLGTDRVADGDDAIRALAEKIPQVQAGTANVTTVLDANATLAVTFPKTFPVVPTVVAGTITAPPGTYQQVVWATSVTAGGFTAAVRRNTSPTTVAVTWIAHAPPTVP